MAITSIMTTDQAIRAKAGANVSTAITDSQYDDWVLHAENYVNILARENYSDSFSGLNVDVKYFLGDIVSSMVAIQAIMYDMSGYTSRTEAEDMINVLRDGLLRNLSLLRDKKNQKFMDDA